MSGSDHDTGAPAVDSTLGRLLRGALHEVGNPLVALGGTLELLLADAESGSQQARRLALARRTADEISDIVRTLQRLARERLEPATEVDLPAFVRDTAEIARRFSPESDAGLAVAASGDATPIRRQPAELRAALLSAMLDALEAAPRGTIDVQVEGGRVFVAGTAVVEG